MNGEWGRMKKRVGNNFFYLKVKGILKKMRIGLDLAFSLLLRWTLSFKDDSIIRTRTYNRP